MDGPAGDERRIGKREPSHSSTLTRAPPGIGLLRGGRLRTRPTGAYHTPELDPVRVGGEGNACRDGLSFAGRATSDEDRTRSLGGRAGQFVLPWDRFEEVSEFALSEGPRVKRGV